MSNLPCSPIPPGTCNRRRFLKSGALAAVASKFVLPGALGDDGDEVASPSQLKVQPPPSPSFSPSVKANAKVAIVRCRSFGTEVHDGMARAFDLLGGVGSLVREKTVTVKLNLTGSNFDKVFGRPAGDSFMTHPDSALALTKLLFQAGAARIRFVESTQRRETLRETVADGGWDVPAFDALGRVEWENTRNLGVSKQYSTLKVPSGGYLFSSFQLNRAYEDTDILVSLSKLKNHLTCGVTLAMKNLFGITPNSLYGGQAPDERATEGRGPLHHRREYKGNGLMPGERGGIGPDSPFFRVPHIVADVCEARPIHLSIIDGVVSMRGGEGPWAPSTALTTPGMLIVGLNPVSTDAVGTAAMGYPDPRAIKGTRPFQWCDNHLLLAEQRGVGVLDLSQIEVLGEKIRDVVCNYG